MIEIRQTPAFRAWLAELADPRARARIASRIERLRGGNPGDVTGDVKSLGSGLSEMRVDHGPGYRVYFTRRGPVLCILLCGGDKSSQARDIAAARRLAETI